MSEEEVSQELKDKIDALAAISVKATFRALEKIYNPEPREVEIDRLNTVVEQQKNLIASLRAELTESYSIDEGDHEGRQLEWERAENKRLRAELGECNGADGRQ